MSDTWTGFDLPVLFLTQGDRTLSQVIYSERNLLPLIERMDVAMLRQTGMVLPSRTWQVRLPGEKG